MKLIDSIGYGTRSRNTSFLFTYKLINTFALNLKMCYNLTRQENNPLNLYIYDYWVD